MKWLNLDYQCDVLNRLANMAYRKGGLEAMRKSLDLAMERIWSEIERITYHEI